MKNIVKLNKSTNTAVATLANIAKLAEVDYKHIRKVVSENKDKFAELGLEVASDGRNEGSLKELPFDYYQASFLITLMRNSDVVTRFKVELIKQFKVIRENQLALLQGKLETATNGATYKMGHISLRKYLKTLPFKLTQNDAWQVLLDEGVVKDEIQSTQHKVLLDDSYGSTYGPHASPIFSKTKLDGLFLNN